MGYAGNTEPNYIVPTMIATPIKRAGLKVRDCQDLDFYIGKEALTAKKQNYHVDSPIKHGIVENWDKMEQYWQRCIFQYLRGDPEEHFCLLVFFFFFFFLTSATSLSLSLSLVVVMCVCVFFVLGVL